MEVEARKHPELNYDWGPSLAFLEALKKADDKEVIMIVGLRFISGKYEGAAFVIAGPKSLTIGRGQDADLILAEDMVSRRHARFDIQNSHELEISDLGSTNGTFINGKKISRATAHIDDRVLIGTSIIKIIQDTDLDDQRPQDLATIKQNMREIASQTAERSTMSGDLADVPVQDLITLFASNNKSGVLTISGANRGKIYLRNGHLQYAVIGGDVAVAPMKAICRMVGWREGNFQLDDKAAASGFPESLELPTPNLLMEAARHYDEFHNVMALLPSAASDLTLSVPMVPLLSDLDAKELDILQLVLNFNTLQTVLDKSRLTDLDAAQTLKKLLADGYLEVD